MAQALTLLFISSLLKGVLCEWISNFPKTVEALKGSCVTIPCSFDIDSTYNVYLDDTCKAIWESKDKDYYTSLNSELTTTKEMTGDLTRNNCTTTFTNVDLNYTDRYYFRLDCQTPLKWTFTNAFVNILVKADPPSPTLTPSTLEVKEGASVRLSCSAPVPCVSHPPTLTWSPNLGDSQETLQDNQDKTQVMTSTLTFTASHLHHGTTISCTATYNRQGGPEAAASTSLSPHVSYSPKTTTMSVSLTGPVAELSNVMLTCTSSANPAVTNYSWYKADGGRDTFIKSGRTLTIQASELTGPFFCVAENDLGAGRSNISQIDLPYYPYRGILPWAVAAVSLSANVICAIFMVFLWKEMKNAKPIEEDRIYMSLDRKDRPSEYDVIAQTRN